ncbi:MAG: hypothetical protein IKW33_01590 [Clostridia bacterium]|nr:hypothetical protein [Clostridia bacterium]
MQFTNPTTKKEMYDILKDLFMYYRINREPFEEPELPTLNIQTMQFVPLTDEEIKEKATTLLLGEQEKDKAERKASLLNKKSALLKKQETIEKNIIEFTATTEETYAKSKKTLRAKGINNGLIDSNLILKEILQLEESKNAKILEYASKCMDDKKEILAELEIVEEELNNIDEYFSSVHQGQILAKVQQLKEEQSKLEREVFKYNNDINEKIQRAESNNLKTTLTLKVKYLEIRSQPVPHDDLVELGYYAKVVNCVTAYYNLFTPKEAYNDIKNEVQLTVYLDEFYEYIVYAYKSQLNVEGV